MNAGLPGTGLGGLFYLVLALLMPVRELYLTARGRSSRQRWRLVLQQLLIAAAILTALGITGTLLRGVLHAQGALGLSGASVLLVPAAVAATLLAALVVLLRVWALLAGRPARQDARGAASRPHPAER